MDENLFEANFKVKTPAAIRAIAGCDGDTYLAGNRAYILFPSVASKKEIAAIIEKVAAEVTDDARGFHINFESNARGSCFGVMMPRSHFCNIFSVFGLG